MSTICWCACAQVPAYRRFINERFERCLDLYLCPRTRRKRVFVTDASTLVPQLPRPRDLQPFPTQLAQRFLGHTGAVRALPFRRPLQPALGPLLFLLVTTRAAGAARCPGLPAGGVWHSRARSLLLIELLLTVCP